MTAHLNLQGSLRWATRAFQGLTPSGPPLGAVLQARLPPLLRSANGVDSERRDLFLYFLVLAGERWVLGFSGMVETAFLLFFQDLVEEGKKITWQELVRACLDDDAGRACAKSGAAHG